jgi:hypothetical protein
MMWEALHRTRRVVLKIALGICLLRPCFQAAAFGQVRIYPEPQQVEVLKTNFPLDGQPLIVLPLQGSRNDSLLASFLVAELAVQLAMPRQQIIAVGKRRELGNDFDEVLSGPVPRQNQIRLKQLTFSSVDPHARGHVGTAWFAASSSRFAR